MSAPPCRSDGNGAWSQWRRRLKRENRLPVNVNTETASLQIRERLFLDTLVSPVSPSK